MIDSASSANPHVLSLLRNHPRIGRVDAAEADGILFRQGDWSRRVSVANPAVEVHGLVELMDNNPMVCADEVSVPGPAATLALLALGPIALAGLIIEPPTMITNAPEPVDGVLPFLPTIGLPPELTFFFDEQDLKGAYSANIIAAISTPSNLDDIDDLYEERYGRSFFIQRNEEGDWDVKHVLGKPHAEYRLRIAPDQPHSLLTIQVMADANGKCGAAQLVHALNVMAGIEESLGLQA